MGSSNASRRSASLRRESGSRLETRSCVACTKGVRLGSSLVRVLRIPERRPHASCLRVSAGCAREIQDGPYALVETLDPHRDGPSPRCFQTTRHLVQPAHEVYAPL